MTMRAKTTSNAWFSAALAISVASSLGVVVAAPPSQRVATRHVLDAPVPDVEGIALPAPDEALTLEELEQRALVGNPSIARAQALLSAARGRWVQVGLPPNPVVGFLGQQIGSDGLAEQDGALVEQEFVRGGKLRLNRAVASQDVARAEQELAAQQQRVLTDVRIAYFNLLVAQRQAETTHQLVDIAQRGAEAADALFNAKEVSRADVLQAELEVENSQILAQNARNRLTASWQQLAAVVGDPQMPQQRVEGDLHRKSEPLEWSPTIGRLLSTSPEIAAASANIERARWNLQRQMVEPRPNVTVQGVVNWRDNGIGGGSDGSVQVTLPLPAWNKNQGGISEAQCEVVAAQRALEQLELYLQQRLAPVYERYQNANNQVTRYEKRILPAAQESLELTRRMYAAGETNYITLLTAQRTFSQTQLNYLEALRELRAAETEIDGLLLSSSLEAR